MLYYIEVKRPTLQELQKYVVSNLNYAQRWKDIGIRLKLHAVDLDDIQRNSFNRSSKEYFQDMLGMWMRKSLDPSWDKIISAINDSELSTVSEITHTGMNATLII